MSRRTLHKNAAAIFGASKFANLVGDDPGGLTSPAANAPQQPTFAVQQC